MDWKAKTGTSYTYVRRAYENRDLRYAIGALLPYTGLWDSFTLRKLDYVIGSHSLEVRFRNTVLTLANTH
jgi:Protein of unknown function (DUF3723)